MISKNKSFDAYLCFCAQGNCSSRYKVLHNRNSNTYGIHYVEKCTDISYSDKTQKLKLKEGYLYLFPSNVEFSILYENPHQENYYKHTWFGFLAMPGLCETIIEYNVNEIPALKVMIPLIKAVIKDDFLQGHEELNSARNKIISLILTILNDITPFRKDENEILEKVIFYIQANLNSDLSIERLSNVAMLNRTYFYKLFTERIKMSPHRYIIEIKMLKGKMLLRTNCKIAQIAEATGFNDAKAFSRAFKNYTGYSPAEFKNTDINFE